MVGMMNALEARIEKGESVFLLSHFPDTFSQIERRLERSSLEFTIISGRVDSAQVLELTRKQPGRLFLTMAQMLKLDRYPLPKREQPSLAVAMCQRHPMPSYDSKVAHWCRESVFPTQLGYFLSLEDPVVDHVVNDQVKLLLRQFGLGENELITSSMVSRRLDSVLKRKAAKVESEVDADSVLDWLKLNYGAQ